MSVVIIGGGAAGMSAAVFAREAGAKTVILIEKNEKLGKKLYITGKGRCNLTNASEPQEFLKAVVNNPRFLSSALYGFPPSELIAYCESYGLRLKTERGNRVFPQSDKSSDVIEFFKKRLSALNVDVKLNERVSLVTQNKEGFSVKTDKNIYDCSSLIIATGGLSYPLTGSNGDGYGFAECFGHSVKSPVPALSQIILKGAFNANGAIVSRADLPFPEGLSLKNVTLKAVERGTQKPFYDSGEVGEALFTDKGLSGPLALSLSSFVNRKLDKNIEAILDFKPALTEEQLDKRIVRDFSATINKQFKNSLNDLLPKSLIPYIIELSGISPDKGVNSITKKERTVLIQLIKKLTLPIEGLGRIEEAIITAGGVNVKEVSPSTMESKIVKKLYFAGELLDVDALTGGYNLHIAISTGKLAGEAAALND